MTGGWPVPLRGVTETVVATPSAGTDPVEWDVAALGVHAGEPVTARTWGRTRTRRNIETAIDERGATAPTAFDPGSPAAGDAGRPAAIVQFVDDPVAFVRAALGRWTRREPVLDPDTAAAWVAVGVDRRGSGTDGGTEWVDWALHPGTPRVKRRTVPTVNRGFGAVVDATVAASRLGVPAYDGAALRDRLDDCARIARRCGGTPEHEAVALLGDLTDGWEPPGE
jgi:hypothetical protein